MNSGYLNKDLPDNYNPTVDTFLKMPQNRRDVAIPKIGNRTSSTSHVTFIISFNPKEIHNIKMGRPKEVLQFVGKFEDTLITSSNTKNGILNTKATTDNVANFIFLRIDSN